MFDEFTNEVLTPLSDGVNRTTTHNAPRDICGLGYVILSRTTDRQQYIEKCLKTNTLAIMTDRNEVIADCYVARDVWQYIKFPEDIQSLGSMLFWCNPPHTHKPFIICTINKRNELLEVRKENCFKFNRESDLGSVAIEGNGDNGVLNVLIDGETENTGKYIIKLLNSITAAVMSIYVQGNIELEADDTVSMKIRKAFLMKFIDEETPQKSTEISYVLGEGFKYIDEFKNQIIINERISIKNNQTSLKTILNGMLKMYIQTTTIDGMALSPTSIKQATDLLIEVSKIFV